jgi:toxin ParE1/3/4
MRVRWAATALAEVQEILRYIASNNPTAASAAANEIEATVDRISGFPEFARIVFQGDVRAVMIGRFGYRLFYAIRDNELIIRNVRHTRRRRPWEQ